MILAGQDLRFPHTRELCLSLAFFALNAPALALEIASLKCEHLPSPHGVDSPQPRLSWTLASDVRGDRQTAYRILVATTPDKLTPGQADAWDSGKVASHESVLILYAGRELQSHERLYWAVQVWDRSGNPSRRSRPSDWIMGVLDDEEWSAKWIGLKVPPRIETLSGAEWIWFPESSPTVSAPLGKRYFRRSFEVPSSRSIEHAVLRITADDHVEIYLNGRSLGTRSGPTSTKELDLTHLLTPGENVIAACAENRGEAPNPAGLIAWMQIEYDQGKPQQIASDAEWMASDRQTPDWTLRDFDDSAWVAAKSLGEVGIEPWGAVRYAESRRLPARYLRKEFVIEKTIRRATVSWCGLGCSELFANGQRVGDQVMSPAMSQYPERSYYVTRDVTKSLKVGPNALGATLGNGRYYAPRSEVYAGMPTYGSPMLLARLTVEHEDGSTTVVTSDESWRMTDDGPIRANNEYDGEEYDARRELGDWASPDYNAAAWRPVEILSRPSQRIDAEPIAPMRVTETIQPKAMHQPRPGVYVFDLGQNIVGWCRLKARGPAGTTIRLRHAERLTDERELYLANLRGAKATDRYTLRGEGEEVWAPRFTLHGFRYVELTGYPGEPSLETIEGLVVHDDMQPVGEFACSDETINQIYQNARWGFRGNYRTVPLDCPQRDERQGWLGDRLEVCRGESYVFNVAPFYAKWLADIRDSQQASGSLPDIAPIHWPRFTDNVVWPSAAVIVPGMLADQYGDLQPLERQYDSNARWIDHMAEFVRADGLIDRDSYGDWCVPPESPELIHSQDPARITETTFLASVFFYHDLKLMQQYARQLDRAEDATRFADMAQRLQKAINDTYYDSMAGQYSNGSQTSSVLPLAFGLTPTGERDRLARTLARHIEERDEGAIATGLVGGQFLCRALNDIGRPDLAYRIASRREYPSWGYMVSQGATTIWELWNGDTANPAMNSGNHVMLIGDLIVWLYEDVAGIAPDPEHTGFRRIIMRPQPVEGLDHARASFESPYGLVESAWRREAGTFRWRVLVQPGATAEVHFPAAEASHVTEAGAPLAEAKGIVTRGVEQGRVVAEIESGEYEFAIDDK